MHGPAGHVDDEHADRQDEIPAHHHHGDPEGDYLQVGQRDEGRGEEQLVGDGIQERTEPRLAPAAPGDVPVEQIGQARQAEHHERLRRAPVHQERDEDGNQTDAEAGSTEARLDLLRRKLELEKLK